MRDHSPKSHLDFPLAFSIFQYQQPLMLWLQCGPLPISLPWCSPKPKHRLRQEWHCPETFLDTKPPETYHFLDLSLGGGFRGIRKRARIGCISHRAGTHERYHQYLCYAEPEEALTLTSHDPPPSYSRFLGPPFSPTLHLRGAPSAISIAVIPRDQMSLYGGERRGTGECSQ